MSVPVGPIMVSIHNLCTIECAQELYRSAESIVRHSALRQVINQMIDKDFRTEFSNDSYLDALILTEVMFDRSRESIRILSGNSCDTFLSVLGRSFSDAVKRLSRTGGKVQVVAFSDAPARFIQDLRDQYPNVLEFARAKLNDESSPIEHFVVCDAKMARIEEPHPRLQPNTRVDAVRAKVYFNDPSKSHIYDVRFQSCWKALFPPHSE